MEPIIGSVFPWPMAWAPRGFALCEGQLLPIRSNTPLFSIIGTTYGGDGTTTFALPDMRGSVALGVGQGPGLTSYVPGEDGGDTNVTLLTSEMPMHAHTLNTIAVPVTTAPAGTIPNINTGATASLSVGTNSGTSTTPGGSNVPAIAPSLSSMPSENDIYGASDGSASINVNVNINPAQSLVISQAASKANGTLNIAGSSLPHNNMQPYVVVNYIIALEGIFPQFD